MNRKEAIKRMSTLKGEELHQLANEYNVTIFKENGKTNKGWAGHAIERFLELPLNSSQSPNFGSWELKVIPVKKLKNGAHVFKETMAVTMIDPVNVCQKEFSESHLLAKLRKAVIVVRTVGSDDRDPSYVHSINELDLDNNPELYQAIKNDYDLVRNTLLNNSQNLNSLSGKMGKYIQPRTKGKGHGSISRAFYARKCFLYEIITL